MIITRALEWCWRQQHPGQPNPTRKSKRVHENSPEGPHPSARRFGPRDSAHEPVTDAGFGAQSSLSGEPWGTEMGKWSMRTDSGLFAGPGVLITGAAHAHAECNEPTTLVRLATTF